MVILITIQHYSKDMFYDELNTQKHTPPSLSFIKKNIFFQKPSMKLYMIIIINMNDGIIAATGLLTTILEDNGWELVIASSGISEN